MDSDESATYKRSVDALRNREERVIRLILDGWSSVTPEDLRQFQAQAEHEAEIYSKRDRPTLAGTFEGLAELASNELNARSSGDEPTLWFALEADLDETSGQEANKDDVAIIIVRALAHMSEANTRTGTRNLWGRVVAQMMTNRDRLQMLGLSL